MGLILKQQMKLIVAYIWKIENVVKSRYGKVNLEFIYVFRSTFMDTNNQLNFNFFISLKLIERLWLLDGLYHRRKEMKNLSRFDHNECLLKCESKVDKFLLGKIYMC